MERIEKYFSFAKYPSVPTWVCVPYVVSLHRRSMGKTHWQGEKRSACTQCILPYSLRNLVIPLAKADGPFALERSREGIPNPRAETESKFFLRILSHRCMHNRRNNRVHTNKDLGVLEGKRRK